MNTLGTKHGMDWIASDGIATAKLRKDEWIDKSGLAFALRSDVQVHIGDQRFDSICFSTDMIVSNVPKTVKILGVINLSSMQNRNRDIFHSNH
jgi:hypothetical protein